MFEKRFTENFNMKNDEKINFISDLHKRFEKQITLNQNKQIEF